MIKKKPMTAEERTVKYTEFAAEFGNDNNLDMYGRHLNFVEFYCLDIIVPFFIVLFVVSYLVFKVVRKMISCCFARKIKRE